MNLYQIANRLTTILFIALTMMACVAQTSLPSMPPAEVHGRQPTPIPSRSSLAAQPMEMPGAGNTPSSLPNFSHIFIIVMENKEASSIIGNPNAPYLNSLAARYARAINFYGVGHPSLPNYLALTGGSTFGINSDCINCFVDAANIVDQLETAGRSWKAYMESMPQPCFVGDAGLYAQRHNPFIYYDDIRTDPARCNKIVPFDQFATDLEANTLPDYIWITPNVCNDMHDCPVSTGDNWLQIWVPRILASPAWKDNGVLFITFDEGTSGQGTSCGGAAGGNVDTLVISPLAQPGFTSSVPYDHYALLHTIEAAWGLPPLGSTNDICAVQMDDFFAGPLTAIPARAGRSYTPKHASANAVIIQSGQAQ